MVCLQLGPVMLITYRHNINTPIKKLTISISKYISGYADALTNKGIQKNLM